MQNRKYSRIDEIRRKYELYCYILKKYIHVFDLPKVSVIDVLEIVILAFVIYHVALWIKNTRAWTLLKGIIVLLACYVIAYILGMNVIVWIFERTISIGITALMIVFQPELRRALEELGQKISFPP